MESHKKLEPVSDAQVPRKKVNLTDRKIDSLLSDLLGELLGLWQTRSGYLTLEEKVKMSKKICNFIAAFEGKKKNS